MVLYFIVLNNSKTKFRRKPLNKTTGVQLNMKSCTVQRLLGVDLLRGIAAYAVVFVHSGDESLGLPISQAAISLRMLFYFAVPFFLATSFYFLTSKAEIDTSQQFWRSRVDRILIPYAVWSIIYIIFRSIFFLYSHQMDRLQDWLRDPLAIVFFGGASYQLYFLPLLFTGTFLVMIAKYMQKIHTSRIIVGCLAIFSLIAYEWLLSFGNAFRLNPNTAFQNLFQTAGWDLSSFPLLRLFLVQIAWLLNCLPFLFIGILLIPLCDRINRWNSFCRLITACLCGAIFLLSSPTIFVDIPSILRNVLQAYSLLLISIILSGYIKKGWIFQSVGNCSFGIYLIHPFAMLGVKGVAAKILPVLSREVSIASMIIISIGSFMISWMSIALIRRNKWIAKYTLGI
jgi:peptidoglycan/LPS O-acetylase OafA/YrhL